METLHAATALLLLLHLAPSPAHAAGANTVTTGMPALVMFVRHAEKAEGPGSDPPLTEAGQERARSLAQALKDAGVTAIITSDRLRTRATAEPLAAARGLTPTVVGLGRGGVASHVAAVAAEIRRQTGGVVVVVGHSNTIPAIIEALGGPSLPDIPDPEYGRLFLLAPGPDGMRLVQARYGAGNGEP